MDGEVSLTNFEQAVLDESNAIHSLQRALQSLTEATQSLSASRLRLVSSVQQAQGGEELTCPACHIAFEGKFCMDCGYRKPDVTPAGLLAVLEKNRSAMRELAKTLAAGLPRDVTAGLTAPHKDEQLLQAKLEERIREDERVRLDAEKAAREQERLEKIRLEEERRAEEKRREAEEHQKAEEEKKRFEGQERKRKADEAERKREEERLRKEHEEKRRKEDEDRKLEEERQRGEDEARKQEAEELQRKADEEKEKKRLEEVERRRKEEIEEAKRREAEEQLEAERKRKEEEERARKAQQEIKNNGGETQFSEARKKLQQLLDEEGIEGFDSASVDDQGQQQLERERQQAEEREREQAREHEEARRLRMEEKARELERAQHEQPHEETTQPMQDTAPIADGVAMSAEPVAVVDEKPPVETVAASTNGTMSPTAKDRAKYESLTIQKVASLFDALDDMLSSVPDEAQAVAKTASVSGLATSPRLTSSTSSLPKKVEAFNENAAMSNLLSFLAEPDPVIVPRAMPVISPRVTLEPAFEMTANAKEPSAPSLPALPTIPDASDKKESNGFDHVLCTAVCKRSISVHLKFCPYCGGKNESYVADPNQPLARLRPGVPSTVSDSPKASKKFDTMPALRASPGNGGSPKPGSPRTDLDARPLSPRKEANPDAITIPLSSLKGFESGTLTGKSSISLRKQPGRQAIPMQQPSPTATRTTPKENKETASATTTSTTTTTVPPVNNFQFLTRARTLRQITCTKCADVFTDDNRFCPNCGTEAERPSLSPRSPRSPRLAAGQLTISPQSLEPLCPNTTEPKEKLDSPRSTSSKKKKKESPAESPRSRSNKSSPRSGTTSPLALSHGSLNGVTSKTGSTATSSKPSTINTSASTSPRSLSQSNQAQDQSATIQPLSPLVSSPRSTSQSAGTSNANQDSATTTTQALALPSQGTSQRSNSQSGSPPTSPTNQQPTAKKPLPLPPQKLSISQSSQPVRDPSPRSDQNSTANATSTVQPTPPIDALSNDAQLRLSNLRVSTTTQPGRVPVGKQGGS